ncbi:MAG: hypothetical protein ABEJ83_01035 [Candidatus Nanohaloarchaea archaeon]
MAEFIVPDANLLIWLDKADQIDILLEHYEESTILISKRVLGECEIEDKDLLINSSQVSIQDPNPEFSRNLGSRPSKTDIQVLTLADAKKDSLVISDDPDVCGNCEELDLEFYRLLEFLKELREGTIDSEDFHFKAGVAKEDLRLPEDKVDEVRDWERNELQT